MTVEFIVLGVAAAAVLAGLGASVAVKRRKGARAAATLQAWVMVVVAVLALVLSLTDEHHRLLHGGLFLVLFATAVSQVIKVRKGSTATPRA